MGAHEIRIDNRKDILLLLLLAPGSTQARNEPISGRTRLMKLIFLFYEELIQKLPIFKNLDPDIKHNFRAYHYGPFSKEVFDDIQFLENANLISERAGGQLSMAELAESRLFYDELLVDWIERDETPEDDVEPIYILTEKGQEFAESMYNLLRPKERKELEDFKTRFNSIQLSALLRYVYTTYPELSVKSKISNLI